MLKGYDMFEILTTYDSQGIVSARCCQRIGLEETERVPLPLLQETLLPLVRIGQGLLTRDILESEVNDKNLLTL